jgi:hypothetical protein
MPSDLASVLVVALTAGATFLIVRLLSRRWRARRRDEERAQQRAAETRQVRRARERRGK